MSDNEGFESIYDAADSLPFVEVDAIKDSEVWKLLTPSQPYRSVEWHVYKDGCCEYDNKCEYRYWSRKLIKDMSLCDRHKWELGV